MNIEEILIKISDIANSMNIEVYAVGGYVRDKVLNIKSKDIDLVVIGDSIAFTKELTKHLKTKNIALYKKFMTSKLEIENYEFEFVSARSESYELNSRKPKVATASLYDDLARRDFTINAIAMKIDKHFGEFIDPFKGLNDIKDGLIRTPLPPDITFSDDPLRMLRAIRFASRFNYTLIDNIIFAIKKNLKRMDIVSRERIMVELEKMLLNSNRIIAIQLLIETGLFKYLFPFIKSDYFSEIKNFYRIESLEEWDFDFHITYLTKFINSESDRTKFLKQMKCSNKTISFVNKIIKCTPHFNNMQQNRSVINQRKYIFNSGMDFIHYLKFFTKTESNISPQLYQSLKAIDELDHLSKFSLKLNGNEIQSITGLEGKKLGDLIKSVSNDVIDCKVNNEIKSLKKYILQKIK